MTVGVRRRAGGYAIAIAVALGLGVIGTFVLGRSYSELALQKESFDRLSYVPSFDPIEDATLGISPNSSNVVASKPDAAIRAVRVFPTQIIEVAGGKGVKVIDTPAPTSLRDLVAEVNDPAWLASAGDVITVKAAVIVENGSSLTISAPTTKEVVMQVGKGVFLAVSNGALKLDGVYVHASDKSVPKTYSGPDQTAGRPFIWAVNSKLNIDHSTFRYLGRDWNSSYGVAWSKGSVGQVTNSLFEHNFIGVYTNASPSLLVQNNKFFYNSLYGVDPHSGSTNMIIIGNTSNYNGRHGIIFSDHVTKGVVKDNVTEGNGLNGIMMDAASTGNQISNNMVRNNRSDGIVLANSDDNTVLRNTVTGNRIGVTVRGTTQGAVIKHNVITGNRLATQGVEAAGNKMHGNGGEWSLGRIGAVWLSAVILLVVMLIVTWTTSRRRDGRGASGGTTPRIGTATS